MPIPHPALADLPGVWRRTLVREADGSTDRVSAVTWVQGPALFGDLRRPPGLDEVVGRAPLAQLDRPQLLALCEQKAFAGTLEQDGDRFSWVRQIDLHPSAPLPDAGTLHWADGVLVEEGLHEAYLEHWEPVERPSAPGGRPPGGLAAAALLDDPAEGCAGVLVRVGSWFCYARDRSAPLPTRLVPLAEQVRGCADRAQAAALLDCEVSIGRVHADRWEIVASTLPQRVGVHLRPEPNREGDGLRITDTDPAGRDRPRDWRLARVEGPGRLLAG
ncbi:hypothetical protein P3T36_007716 [Kitasatospora sp. MAP12-15]|uniref:hypothetical protein n=1 Tax=unclassified Kitasatospora TaxID=2633591 RepID=UPI002474B0D6|nr:hypothetical protein [Kitasatospora sp. MAP12-44]MDH6108540.1 hypothetical protein [Kitasatospora sp. MAP12-44]